MSARTRRVLTLPLLSAVLALATLTAPSGAIAPDETAPPVAADDDATAAAQEALATVRDLLGGVLDLAQPDGAHTELTLALRDLALLKNDLPADQRPAAERLLARPTDGNNDQFNDGYKAPEQTPVCSDVVCVHYVTTTQDKVPAGDANTNGVPDYVDFAVATMTNVHNTYVAAGYRPPKSDLAAANNGGNALPDVYLTNVGDDGFYGYCATDQNLPANQPQDTWGYCVLDNDYANDEFPAHTPKQNFQVTAAHEYFHAVQFGYDVSEDGWVMEATATWAEDELYDGVNDNVAYLRGGPMKLPHMSLDQFFEGFHYGTWIFFRHLTERFGTSVGGMPTLVRDLWRRLDDAPGGHHDYSLEGLKKVLQRRDMSLTEAFARFSAANRSPGRSYDEGKANNYPQAPLAATRTLTKRAPRTGQLQLTLDHLAAGTIRYKSGDSLGSDAWRLRLSLDMAARWKGTGAILTIQPRSGSPRTKLVKLNKDGNAAPTLAFSTRRVRYVEVTLVNASDDFRCNRNTRFSCQGQPKFDNSVQRIGARVFKS